VDAFTGELTAQDQNSNWIIETQYRFPLSKNITITPGLYVLLQPNSNSNNDSIWVGVLRTNFSF
jgi:carbohydrate-selective porin OprB